jgi:SAM-dependent methyltransferase
MKDARADAATRSYAQQHFVEGVEEAYDGVYEPSTYDSFIWNLQRPFVRRTLEAVRARNGRLSYLDFACGTGRIIAAVDDLTTTAVGVDISPLMLSRAAHRVSASTTLREGDLLASPELVDRAYDAVTAFRFFANTEANLRLPIMSELARRLRGADSRFIFNIHANALSALVLTGIYRKVNRWPAPAALRPSEVRRLIFRSGLEIETLRGYGMVPRRLYRTWLAPLARAVDTVASHLGIAAPLAQDIVYVCRLRPDVRATAT